MKSISTTIIIPARMESSRFPGKLLVEVDGKSILRHTLDRVLQVAMTDRVVVATDSSLIKLHVAEWPVEVVFDDRDYSCGTDRCAAAAERMQIHGLVVNVQGDEVMASPNDIDRMIKLMQRTDGPSMASLMCPLEADDLDNPHCVKVRCNDDLLALDFMRVVSGAGQLLYRHIGIYGFTSDALKHFAGLSSTLQEKERSLEQMRWLEHIRPIQMLYTSHRSPSINIPADLDLLRQYTQKYGR